MKRCMLFSIAVFLIISLTACKSTPKESIVKEKNLDQMIEDATKEQAEVVDTPLSNNKEERMGAESTCTKELVDVKGKVKIHVDAQVVVPDTDRITVQRVGQGKITQEQIDVLLSNLMKGDLISGSTYRLSKGEVQGQIDQVQSAIDQLGMRRPISRRPRIRKKPPYGCHMNWNCSSNSWPPRRTRPSSFQAMENLRRWMAIWDRARSFSCSPSRRMADIRACMP